jgi:hypothetical protein
LSFVRNINYPSTRLSTNPLERIKFLAVGNTITTKGNGCEISDGIIPLRVYLNCVVHLRK